MPFLQGVPSVADVSAAAPERLAIMVVYEDGPGLLAAERIIQRVASRVVSDEALCLTFRSFRVLESPMLAKEAAQRAVAADLVLIAAQEQGGWPRAVEDWLDRWIRLDASQPGGLAALFLGDSWRKPARHRRQDALEQVARRSGRRFLVMRLCLDATASCSALEMGCRAQMHDRTSPHRRYQVNRRRRDVRRSCLRVLFR